MCGDLLRFGALKVKVQPIIGYFMNIPTMLTTPTVFSINKLNYSDYSPAQSRLWHSTIQTRKVI